jgi:SAM-dependent methyltransferase
VRAVREDEVRESVQRLAPFAHEIELPFGLTTYVPEVSMRELERTRLPALKEFLWPSLLEHCGGSLAGLRVLDTGCNCGGFSVELSASGAEYVLGIDVVDRYLEQADFVKDVLGLDNVEFRKLAVEELDPENVGQFDITLCLGLLYHFENPVFSMQKLVAVTTRMIVVDTDLDPSNPDGPYWRLDWVTKSGPPDQDENATTGQWRTRRWAQFTPSAQGVEALFRFFRFRNVIQLELPPGKDLADDRYAAGTRGTFLAIR